MADRLKYTAAQVKRSGRHLIHTIASCRDCGWGEDDYRVAARAATTHVRETGHTVGVEQAVSYSVSVPRG